MGRQSLETKLAMDLIGQEELTVRLPKALVSWARKTGAREHSRIPEALDFLYHDFIHSHFESEMLPLIENRPFSFVFFKRAFVARARPVVIRYFDEVCPPARLDLNL